jgi:uncharacterized protein
MSQPDQGKPEEEAARYINPELGVNSVEEAIGGALDIIAEEVSDDAEVRKLVRNKTYEAADIAAKAKKENDLPMRCITITGTVRRIPLTGSWR